MTFKGGIEASGTPATTGGGRGGLIAGGGLGSLVLVGLFLLLGGNLGDLGGVLGGGQDPTGSAGGQERPLEGCKTSDDANTKPECRVAFTGQSVDKVWEKILPEQAGIEYKAPGRHIFTGQASTGCGAASSSTGPFYCPRDKTAYFDVSFFNQLKKLGGDNAPLAQEYIVAHEFGHNIQNLEGTLGLSDYNNPGEDSNAVKIELQADCYAGIWAHYADKGEDAMLEKITPEQVKDAVETAGAVGDDNIQRRTQGDVSPESWTHGSSEQRQKAFLSGYNEGKMSACDTLGRGKYKA